MLSDEELLNKATSPEQAVHIACELEQITDYTLAARAWTRAADLCPPRSHERAQRYLKYAAQCRVEEQNDS